MIRTNIVQLMPNKHQKKILKEMMLLSSSVYNMANYDVRQKFFNREHIPSFYELRQILQKKDDYQLLGRSYALPRIQIYAETNSARFKLIGSKTQKYVGLPSYYKNRKTNTTIPSYLVMDNSQYFIGKNKIRIPLGNKMRKKYNYRKQDFSISYNGILKHKGKQLRGQIHYENKMFYLYQSVELPTSSLKKPQNVAGIDLGAKSLIAMTTNKDNELLIHNKRFFQQYEYFERLIAKEKQSLSQIDRKSSNKLNRIYHHRSMWHKQLFDNCVCKLFRKIKRYNVSMIFVGDVKGIRENMDFFKTANRMTHNYWSFDVMLSKIRNKAEENGVELKLVIEEYTSTTCPSCGNCDKDNAVDRSFVCTKCSYSHHRDLVGSRNIMIKGMWSLIRPHWEEILPLEAENVV